jgi:hypothetical protein
MPTRPRPRSGRAASLVRSQVLAGELVEEAQLAEHRPDAAHLEHQPLHRLVFAAGSAGRKLPGLLGQVEQDRARFEQRQRLAARAVGVEDGRDLVVRVERQELRRQLVVGVEAHQVRFVRQPGLLQQDRHLHAVGRGQRIQLDALRVRRAGHLRVIRTPGQRVARLARLGDRRRVVAVGEDPPAARLAALLGHQRVQPARRRDAQRAHTVGQRQAIVGLAQEVDVVPLDRHVHDAEAGAPGQHQRDHREPHRGVRLRSPKPADLLRHAQDDVHRQPAVVEWPRPMRTARRPRQRPLAPRPLPPAAVAVRVTARAPRRRGGPRQPELLRPRRPRSRFRSILHHRRHVDSAYIPPTAKMARRNRGTAVVFSATPAGPSQRRGGRFGATPERACRAESAARWSIMATPAGPSQPRGARLPRRRRVGRGRGPAPKALWSCRRWWTTAPASAPTA